MSRQGIGFFRGCANGNTAQYVQLEREVSTALKLLAVDVGLPAAEIIRIAVDQLLKRNRVSVAKPRRSKPRRKLKGVA